MNAASTLSITIAAIAVLSAVCAGQPAPPRLVIYPGLHVGWKSSTNLVYQLQWCQELGGPWSNFGPPIRGNGGTNYVADRSPKEPSKFYRLIVLP